MISIAAYKCYLLQPAFYSGPLTLLLSLVNSVRKEFQASILHLHFYLNEMSRNSRDCHGLEKESNVASIYYKSPLLP